MAQGLSAAVDTQTQITTFNTLAMQTQDDAYTLAYYLLGDERHAERATQAAYDALFRQARLQTDQFRFEVLRRVLDCSQRLMRLMPRRGIPRTGAHKKAQTDSTFEKLTTLNHGERSVVVLVDVLGLDYEEAAQVLGSSRKQVSRLLAQARLNLTEREATLRAPLALG